jgi:hypothetical protein
MIFSSKYHQNPQILKRRSIEKRERERGSKIIEREREREKASRISSNKRGSQFFERRKTPQHWKLFLYDSIFFPPSYHFKNHFQIIEKVFITLFGPSFSLAIYMT